ncbi:ribosome biogenesis GTPase Der [Haloferula sp.]|uniref:ribosome biogenesis GTPase Der n=1 Tax=Haloferula sp. TaxID=2497595 RepID=UPI00329EAF98
MPTVAIVGRPNVGKSAIFNRLAQRRIAIVHDQPGVTRDRISAPCKATQHPCTLIDTGGIGASLDDGFGAQVTLEADIALDTADLILFVVDAHEGLTTIDSALSAKLRKAKSPVTLVINKVDDEKHENAFADLARLGLGDGIAISAEHGRGFDRLVAAIDEGLEPLAGEIEEAEEQAEVRGIQLAIVGKPNAGKSSLINAILKDERTIVSEIAGTTRDALDVPYDYEGERFTLVDTAGLRPRVKRDSSVEVFSAMRSEKAIRRADLCLLVIDLAAGVSAQDRKIAQLIGNEQKPCLIVLNKFDLFHPGASMKERKKEAEEQVRRELFFLHYAPYICVSAKEGKAVHGVLKEALSIRKSAQNVPSTGVLNRMLTHAFEKTPPPAAGKGTKRLKLYYATTAVNDRYQIIPVPTFVLFVNDKQLMNKSYEQYLRNSLREAHPAPAIPVIFSVRSRRRRDLEFKSK